MSIDDDFYDVEAAVKGTDAEQAWARLSKHINGMEAVVYGDDAVAKLKEVLKLVLDEATDRFFVDDGDEQLFIQYNKVAFETLDSLREEKRLVVGPG